MGEPLVSTLQYGDLDTFTWLVRWSSCLLRLTVTERRTLPSFVLPATPSQNCAVTYGPGIVSVPQTVC